MPALRTFFPLAGPHAVFVVSLWPLALQWRGRSVIRVPNVWVFHAAYAGVPLGSALIALGSFPPAAIPAQAGIHAWTTGAIALISLAVMTSMARRQTGQSF